MRAVIEHTPTTVGAEKFGLLLGTGQRADDDPLSPVQCCAWFDSPLSEIAARIDAELWIESIDIDVQQLIQPGTAVRIEVDILDEVVPEPGETSVEAAQCAIIETETEDIVCCGIIDVRIDRA